MAVVEVWQRGEIPQARIAVPGRETLADQFGRGLQAFAQAGSQAASDAKQAQELLDEHQWQAEQPKIAKEIAQAGIDFTGFYSDAKAKAPVDLSGLQDQVAQWWDERKAAIASSHTGHRALDYLDLHILDVKGQGIASAIRDTTIATIQVRGDNIQSVVDTEANRLASDPGAYKSSIANVTATLDAQKGAVPQATLTEWGIAARKGLTSAMISGQIGANPEQALTWLNSGDYDADLDPKEKTRLIGQARSLLELRKAQADAAQTSYAIGLQAKVGQAVELYKSGVDFAGFAVLAGELKSAGQIELLQTLTNWKGDADYARSAKSLTPAELRATGEEEDKLAGNEIDPIKAAMHIRHAEIAFAAADVLDRDLSKDALSVAVAANVAQPTDVLSPLLSGDVDSFLAAARDRETARVQTQNKYQQVVGFLTPIERQKLMAAYNGAATADQKVALLDMLAALPESISAEAANELSSLAGGDQIPMYLSFLTENHALGHDIVAGAALLKRYPKMLPEDSSFQQQLDHRFGNLFVENPNAQFAMREATTNYYAALLHSKRGDHDGILDINLLNQAFARVTGGAFPYDNGNNPTQIIIPPRPGMTEAQFEKLVMTIDDNALIGRSARGAPGNAPGWRGPVYGNGRPVTARTIQEDGNFVSFGPGLYRVLINGQPIVDGQTGDAFVLDMNPLLNNADAQ